MKKLAMITLILLVAVMAFADNKANYITQEMVDRAKEVYTVVGSRKDRTQLHDIAAGVKYEIGIQFDHEISDRLSGNYIILSPIDPPKDWLLKDYFENTLAVLEKFLLKVGWAKAISTVRALAMDIFNTEVVGVKTTVYNTEKDIILNIQIGEQEGRFIITLWEYYFPNE